MLDHGISRRGFIAGMGGAVGANLVDLARADAEPGGPTASPEQARVDAFPRQWPALVEETVGASHGRFARVRELVEAWPELATCAWDWGFGDWESPLGAASHVGQRDIARFLIQHGARADLFTWCMLGELDIVKATLAARPELIRATGPHGLPLLHHARAGGDQAVAVRDYLIALGAAEFTPAAATPETIERVVGEYHDARGELRLEVIEQKAALAVRGNGQAPKPLFPVPGGGWSPAGAPSVRLSFEPADARAGRLMLTMNGSRTELTRRP